MAEQGLQQTYDDYLTFLSQESWGKYWHKKYYKKTNYKTANLEVAKATDVIGYLEKIKNGSFNDVSKVVNKTLQDLILETTSIEQLQEMDKSFSMPKELKKAISLAKKLI